MYTVTIAGKAKKQLRKLELCDRERILKTIRRIRKHPFSHVKRLKGDSSYRLRTGDYRVIMEIRNKELIIEVIRIGLRKKIYKK